MVIPSLSGGPGWLSWRLWRRDARRWQEWPRRGPWRCLPSWRSWLAPSGSRDVSVGRLSSDRRRRGCPSSLVPLGRPYAPTGVVRLLLFLDPFRMTFLRHGLFLPRLWTVGQGVQLI